MSVIPESLGGVTQTGDTVRPEDFEATPAASPAAEPETPGTPAEDLTVETKPEVKGPIPYERFEEVVRARQDLEAKLNKYSQLGQIYDLAETNPELAAQAFDTLSSGLRKMHQGVVLKDQPDLEAMTDTERMLYQQIQELKGQTSQSRAQVEAAQDAIAQRDLTEALSGLEVWAKDQKYPFDSQKVISAMDDLNVEGLIQRGVPIGDIARMAYKAVFFDDLPKIVKNQTYGEQRRKASSTLPETQSRGGTPITTVNSVRDAVNAAWAKLGLPDT